MMNLLTPFNYFIRRLSYFEHQNYLSRKIKILDAIHKYSFILNNVMSEEIKYGPLTMTSIKSFTYFHYLRNRNT